jgi:hypothetical protein
MLSRGRRAELRHILLGLALIGGAVAVVANIVWAIMFGAVFLTYPKSHGWTYFEVSPIRFLLSVALSIASAPCLAFFGYLAIKGAKDERHFLERLYTDTPRYEDPSHRGQA